MVLVQSLLSSLLGEMLHTNNNVWEKNTSDNNAHPLCFVLLNVYCKCSVTPLSWPDFQIST
ncbi:hypothetical protein KSF78_0003079 [Schistosoma japonicum]|nr:hypothetical protein KSF78_0003079 [Schistosoma japonicum]